MTREEAIGTMNFLKLYAETHTEVQDALEEKDRVRFIEALDMAIKALSQESEIEENIIKYMKKYPNHVGNTDFWEGFYACRNVVLQLDDEEYAPKEQEPCDDAVSREAILSKIKEVCFSKEWTQFRVDNGSHGQRDFLINYIEQLPPVTQKSGKCKNCKYFEYDSVAKVDGVPLIVAHEICNKWGDGCKTKEDGYCFLFEPQESEE